MKKQLQQKHTREETEGTEAPGAFKDDLVAIARGVETKVTDRLPGHLALRVPTLIGLCVLLMSWLQRQLQWEVETLLASAMAVVTGYSFVLPMIQRFVRRHREQIEEGVVEVMMQYLAFSLRTPALATLAVVTLIPSLFYSNVTVAAAGVVGARELQLYSLQDQDAEPLPSTGSLKGENAVHTFNVFTTPLGRPLMLKVSGFQHKTFNLMPGIGTKIELTELDPSPAVMLRLPRNSLERKAYGQIKLFLKAEGGGIDRLVGVIDTRPGYGAYVFGWFAGGLDGLTERWDRDLAYEADRGIESTMDLESAKYHWGRYITSSFLSERDVLPRQFLEAYFLREPNNPYQLNARIELNVNAHSTLQDHMLVAVGSPEGVVGDGGDLALRSALASAIGLRLSAERLLETDFEDEDGQVLLFRRGKDGLVHAGTIATSAEAGTYVFGVPGPATGLRDTWADELAALKNKSDRRQVEQAWSLDRRSNYDEGLLLDEGLEGATLEAFYLMNAGHPQSLRGYAEFTVTAKPVQNYLLGNVDSDRRSELVARLSEELR